MLFQYPRWGVIIYLYALFIFFSQDRLRLPITINIYDLMKSSDKVVVTKLKKIATISGIFMVVQLLGGYYAHSVAIFADAFHLLSDVVAYMISLFAVLMSYQPSPKGMTFGYQKLQPLGALINVGIIWYVTAELFAEATGRIVNKQIVQEPIYMLATSIFGLLCNLYILNILHHDQDAEGYHDNSNPHQIQSLQNDPQQNQETTTFGADSFTKGICDNNTNIPSSSRSFSMADQPGTSSLVSDEHKLGTQKFRNNINMEAAYIHIFTDIILSIGIMVSATVIYFCAPGEHVWSYWQIADPICTYLFSFLAILSTLPIVKQSLVLLLDGCSNPQTVQDIQRELNSNQNVRKVDSLRVWSTNRGKLYGALRVKVKKGGDGGLLSIFSSRKIEGYVQIQEQQEIATAKD